MIEIPKFKFALREDLKNQKQFLPSKAEPNATGWDVRCAFENGSNIEILPMSYILIPLGFRTFCPEDWWFELKPRSSTFGKKYLHSLYGTIDCDFEGQLLLCAQYIPDFTNKNHFQIPSLKLNFGDAIGQIIPVKKQDMLIQEVDNLEYDSLCKKRNSLRGSGGFGSTG